MMKIITNSNSTTNRTVTLQKSPVRSTLSGVALLLTMTVSSVCFAWSTPQTASGLSVGAEYIQYWDSECTPSSQDTRWDNANTARYFVSQMQKYGAHKQFLYGNTDVWSSDVSDSSRVSWGNDSTYADNVDVYVFKGHGGPSGAHGYHAPMCLPSGWKSWSSSSIWERESFYSSRARFDKKLRWLFLSTCSSLESRPDLTWKNAAGPGFEYIMGYRGNSYTGPSTDEVLGDWVTDAFDERYTFKQAWFDAANDWFFAQTPSVLAFGDSSLSNAINRRDYQYYSWSRRNGGVHPHASAWAWKEWGGIHPARRTKSERSDWNYYSTN